MCTGLEEPGVRVPAEKPLHFVMRKKRNSYGIFTSSSLNQFPNSWNDIPYAVARTYTSDATGTYGMAYDAPSDLDLFF